MEGIHILRSRPHGRVEWAAFRPTLDRYARLPSRIGTTEASVTSGLLNELRQNDDLLAVDSAFDVLGVVCYQ